MALSSPAPCARPGWLAADETQAVFAALAAGGEAARVVGGAVRNDLLGQPITDIDIATTALPQATMQLAEAAGLRAVPTGLAHGTVTVMSGGRPFEVTTLRADMETDGRHAVVAFTRDWAEDAARRDFTMNALYLGADGCRHDPLGGGEADARAGRVRFIGDAAARIREDTLRILRFFRFSAEYGVGPLDAAGLAACVAGRAGLARLSAERVRAELFKLLVAPRAGDVVPAMAAAGILSDVLGRAGNLAHFAQLGEAEAAVSAPPEALRRLVALLGPEPWDSAALQARFRLSRAEAKALFGLSPPHERPADAAAARRELYLWGEATFRSRTLLAGDVAGYDLPDRWPVPVLPVTAADFIAEGVPPGPLLGATLELAEARWLASDFTLTRDELLG